MTIGNAVFEVFHTDVAKLDRDIAYVAIIVHLCCKCLFPVFYLFFRHMLYMFHTYVSSILSGRYVMFAIVFKCFSGVFASVSETCFKCFIYLLCMLQVLYLNVLKLDWDVAHRMCVGIGRLRERSPTRGLAARAKSGRQGLLLELSLASLTLLGRLLACCTGTARALVPRIGCSGASKSDFHEKKSRTDPIFKISTWTRVNSNCSFFLVGNCSFSIYRVVNRMDTCILLPRPGSTNARPTADRERGGPVSCLGPWAASAAPRFRVPPRPEAGG
jgi:hypothetical protein